MSQENPRAALRSLFYGHYRFQFLSAAYRLGLFTALSREPGSTREQIGQQLGIAEIPTRILLLGCASSGLVRKDGEQYFLTPVSELLTKNPDEQPAVSIPWQQFVNYKPMTWFYESLKENTNVGLREFAGDSPDLYGR